MHRKNIGACNSDKKISLSRVSLMCYSSQKLIIVVIYVKISKHKNQWVSLPANQLCNLLWTVSSREQIVLHKSFYNSSLCSWASGSEVQIARLGSMLLVGFLPRQKRPKWHERKSPTKPVPKRKYSCSKEKGNPL